MQIRSKARRSDAKEAVLPYFDRERLRHVQLQVSFRAHSPAGDRFPG